MLNSPLPAIRNQTLIGVCVFALAILVAWQVGGRIADGDTPALIYLATAVLVCTMAFAILKDWRFGTFVFMTWLILEDLARKYMSNSVVLFFAKDALVALIYFALFTAIRQTKERLFRPPFLLYLSLFFWLGVLQIFNQNSPSVLYGLLGLKVDFYYVPLLYIGYSFVRSDEDLRKFLTWNCVLAGLVAAVGITQSVIGNSFLNPENLAPELQELGDLYKATSAGEIFNIPPSVFVSSGRYDQYLILAFILAIGTAGYLLFTSKRGRKLAYLAIGLLGAASLLSGNRGAFLWVLISALVLPVGFLWGAPWRRRQGRRMVKAIRWSATLLCLGVVLVVAIFPEQTGSRMTFYAETLLPSSSDYELSYRSWDYPIQNFLYAFDNPHWVVGNGLGTASLGTQYVAKLTGEPQPNVWVEEGYGDLIIEMGIIAPFLWLLWTGALVWYSWKVVRQLRETRYFPLAFAILWYAFVLLFPSTYASFSGYQNYFSNAYLWLLVGILFRLPELQHSSALGVSAGPSVASRS